jgi:hypothetical protein
MTGVSRVVAGAAVFVYAIREPVDSSQYWTAGDVGYAVYGGAGA